MSEEKKKGIRCGSRKEKGCKSEPTICEWRDNKCYKIEDTPKVYVRTPRCARRKQSTCAELPDKCLWNGEKCITKKNVVMRTPTPKPKTPSEDDTEFAQALQQLQHRHCFYYSSKPSASLPRPSIADLKSCYATKYDSSKKHPTNVHIGQRKLLLSEIQLLTTWYKEQKNHPIVLYVGAAPGSHLIVLSYMFPSAFFILYDGAKFDTQLAKYPNIYELHEGKQGFVDTTMIRNIKKRFQGRGNNSLIFISDIRLDAKDDNAFESAVYKDMQNQQEWMEILRPKMSLLKFRMSYNMRHGDKLVYTKGDIMYQIWPKPASGETRLLVRQADIGKKIPYDFKEYEENMAFHNTYKRPFCYKAIPPELHSYIFTDKPPNKYCPCHDCMAELTVLSEYAKTMRKPMDWAVNIVARHMNRERVPVFLRSPAHLTPLQKIQPSCSLGK